MTQAPTSGAAATLVLWRQLVRAAPGLMSVAALLTAVRAAATVGYVVGIARLVDDVGSSSQAPVAPVLLVLASWAVAQLCDTARGIAVPEIQARWTVSLTDRVLTSLSTAHPASPDPAVRRSAAATLDRVRGWMGLSSIPALWHAVDARLLGLVGVVAVAWWSPLAGLAVAVSQVVTGAAFTRYLDAVHRDLRAEDSPERVRTQYYRDLLLRSGPAKEVRTFGLTPWLLGTHHNAWLEGVSEVWRRRDRAARPSFAALGVLTLVTVATLALLAADAVDGGVSAGGAAAVLQGLVLSAGLGMLGDTLVQVRRAADVASSVDALPATRPEDPPTRADARRPGVVDVRSAGFAYADGRPVLRDLDLHVAPGEKVAVVGPNGAGKSTLVRLLAGLDRPDSGRVEAGRPAVVFQSFARLPATLGDNVLLGGTDDSGDATREAARLSGADELDWTDERVVSAELPGARDLSGGQWQRVALARAFAAVDGGADVLVLDEPTSALDVRVEHELFRRVLSPDNALTTIVVTHRLASIRGVDRIVVVDDGRVVESGTHDELVGLGGRYAEMFRVQAASYREVLDA